MTSPQGRAERTTTGAPEAAEGPGLALLPATQAGHSQADRKAHCTPSKLSSRSSEASSRGQPSKQVRCRTGWARVGG